MATSYSPPEAGVRALLAQPALQAGPELRVAPAIEAATKKFRASAKGRIRVSSEVRGPAGCQLQRCGCCGCCGGRNVQLPPPLDPRRC